MGSDSRRRRAGWTASPATAVPVTPTVTAGPASSVRPTHPPTRCATPPASGTTSATAHRSRRWPACNAYHRSTTSVTAAVSGRTRPSGSATSTWHTPSSGTPPPGRRRPGRRTLHRRSQGQHLGIRTRRLRPTRPQARLRHRVLPPRGPGRPPADEPGPIKRPAQIRLPRPGPVIDRTQAGLDLGPEEQAGLPGLNTTRGGAERRAGPTPAAPAPLVSPGAASGDQHARSAPCQPWRANDWYHNWTCCRRSRVSSLAPSRSRPIARCPRPHRTAIAGMVGASWFATGLGELAEAAHLEADTAERPGSMNPPSAGRQQLRAGRTVTPRRGTGLGSSI